MDSYRGEYGGLGASTQDDAVDEEIGEEAPPAIGADERRMQVRAYNFWASLLDNRNFPHVSDLDPKAMPDFGPNGVLLDFTRGIEDPAITFLGSRLAEECGAEGLDIAYLSDVPARSLLSRITDHYMQILANQAPIGFEAEFVNQRGQTILYRGILLPFSSDDLTIDTIFGVINWKQLADQQSTDELLLEIDQALEESPEPRRRTSDLPMADWADGPAASAANIDIGRAADDDLPAPSFGLSVGGRSADAEPSVPLGEPAQMEPSPMDLAGWLALAREMAAAVRSAEDRTRKALYDAISRAYDFSLVAAQQPEEFAGMVADAGIGVQDRAPMTPVVKLVFGVDYDKTRLTEYAAALDHAHRTGIARGTLGAFLHSVEGGLKGVVQAERRHRRMESGRPAAPLAHGPRKAIARKLRALEPHDFAVIDPVGSEFSLVMIRRTESGDVVVLGEVPEDVPLVERAARQLLG